MTGVRDSEVTRTEHRQLTADDVTIDVHPYDGSSYTAHIIVAYRPEDECGGCGQRIEPGAVGVATWCDGRRCHAGGHNFQHGCGTWNSPVEVERVVSHADVPYPPHVGGLRPDEVIGAMLADLRWDAVINEMVDELNAALARR